MTFATKCKRLAVLFSVLTTLQFSALAFESNAESYREDADDASGAIADTTDPDPQAKQAVDPVVSAERRAAYAARRAAALPPAPVKLSAWENPACVAAYGSALAMIIVALMPAYKARWDSSVIQAKLDQAKKDRDTHDEAAKSEFTAIQQKLDSTIAKKDLAERDAQEKARRIEELVTQMGNAITKKIDTNTEITLENRESARRVVKRAVERLEAGKSGDAIPTGNLEVHGNVHVVMDDPSDHHMDDDDDTAEMDTQKGPS